MNNLTSLICEFIDGEEGSAEILNDALESIGRERVALKGTPQERLELVLTQLMERESAERLACDFAEHVLPVGVIQSGQKKVAKTVLSAKRKYLDKKISFEELREAALPALSGWRDDNQPGSFAIWSLWSAALASPKNTAATAQKVVSTELDWQIERTKSFLRELQGV